MSTVVLPDQEAAFLFPTKGRTLSWVEDIIFTQAIQNADRSFKMITDKPILARAIIGRDSDVGSDSWTAVLKIYYDNPCEFDVVHPIGAAKRTPISPTNPSELPIYLSNLDNTINFEFVLSQEEAAVFDHVSVEVNPCNSHIDIPGYSSVPESDYTNNDKTKTFEILAVDPLYIKYVVMKVSDGGSPPYEQLSPYAAHILPGIGDYMLLSTFPVPWQPYTLLSHVPEALKNDISLGATEWHIQTGKWIDELNDRGTTWVDRLVVWKNRRDSNCGCKSSGCCSACPKCCFGGGTAVEGHIGSGGERVITKAGKASTVTSINEWCGSEAKNQATLAHEFLHTFKVSHSPFGSTIGSLGADVASIKRGFHPECTNCNKLRPEATYSLMMATEGLLSDLKYESLVYGAAEHWISVDEYQHVYSAMESRQARKMSLERNSQSIVLSGVFDTLAAEISIVPAYISNKYISETLLPGDSILILKALDDTNGVIEEISTGLTWAGCMFSCDGNPETEGGFKVGFNWDLLSTNPNFSRISIINGKTGLELESIAQTANEPSIDFLYPSTGETIVHGATIIWSGSDLDGDSITYTLSYSWDGGNRVLPLLMDSEDTAFVFTDETIPGTLAGTGVLYLCGSDGLNFTETEVSGLTFDNNAAPRVNIVEPPAEVVEGSGFILYAAVDDREDEVDDSEIIWSIDGTDTIGVGRILEVARGLEIGSYSIIASTIDDHGAMGADTIGLGVVSSIPNTGIAIDYRSEAVELQYSIRNVPNPFNPITEIEYSIPANGFVRISIHDISGRAVEVLVKEIVEAGIHTIAWNGKTSQGNESASGIYFIRLEAAGVVKTGKITLVR